MIAPAARKQRTFYVGEHKIQIISQQITRQANHVGWNININGTKSRHFVLDREHAEDSAYDAWVKIIQGEAR